MNRATLLLGLLALGCSSPRAGGQAGQAPVENAPVPRVTLETSAGKIVIELDPVRAPKSVANYLLLVRGGFYNGLVFHRVKPNFMVQAGYVTSDMRRRAVTRPPIYNEADNGLKNVRGAVAMARTSYPHSATTEFFINVVDNAKLDFTAATDAGFGYAVFGHVVEGLNVVDAIAATPTTHRDEFADWPTRPITIERAYVDTTANRR